MTADSQQDVKTPRATTPRQFTLRALLGLLTVCGFAFALVRGAGVPAVLLFLLGVGIAAGKTRTAALMLAVSFVLLPVTLFVLVSASPLLIVVWVVVVALCVYWADEEYRTRSQRRRTTVDENRAQKK